MPDVTLVSLALSLAWGASAAQNSIVAPTGADTLTVALLGGSGKVHVCHATIVVLIAEFIVRLPRTLDFLSLDSTLLEKLTDTFHEIPKRHPDLIAVLLTETGAKSFIGGADLGETGSLESPVAARQFITRVHHACKKTD